MEATRKHVLFVSFPFVSHISCFLQLARKVSRYHDVTFVASEIRVKRLRERSALNKEDAKSISIVGLRDGITQEEADDSSFEGMWTMVFKYREAMMKLMPSFPVPGEPPGMCQQSHLVDPPITLPVDVYIVDRVASAGAGQVIDRGVPVLVFCPTAGFMFSNKIFVDKDTPVLSDDAFFSDCEALADVSRTGLPLKFKEAAMAVHGLNGLSKRLHGVIFNSIAELEPVCIQMLRSHGNYGRMPLRFVAPLFESTTAELSHRDVAVMEWMNKQPARSVVYASFGTMAVSNREQVKEIAKALLFVGKPFIWGLRQQEHQYLPAEMRQEPEHDSRFLVLPWVPQKAILGHGAAAVFLSHAGWNSYLESMDCGVPMVAWPLFGDHFGVAEMVVDTGAGIKILGTSMLFRQVIPAETIVESIQTVGEWKEGQPTGRYARNAREVGLLIRNASLAGGSSDQAFMDLVKIDIGQSTVTRPVPKVHRGCEPSPVGTASCVGVECPLCHSREVSVPGAI